MKGGLFKTMMLAKRFNLLVHQLEDCLQDRLGFRRLVGLNHYRGRFLRGPVARFLVIQHVGFVLGGQCSHRHRWHRAWLAIIARSVRDEASEKLAHERLIDGLAEDIDEVPLTQLGPALRRMERVAPDDEQGRGVLGEVDL